MGTRVRKGLGAACLRVYQDSERNCIMKNTFSRRNFVRSGALVAAAFAASGQRLRVGAGTSIRERSVADSLGLASYTFRNFSRAQMIGFMKQLNVLALNAKDVKDHLPMDPAAGGGRACGLCRGWHQASRRRSHLFPER